MESVIISLNGIRRAALCRRIRQVLLWACWILCL